MSCDLRGRQGGACAPRGRGRAHGELRGRGRAGASARRADAGSRPPQCAFARGGEEKTIRFRVWMVVVSYIHFILGQAVGLNHGLEV